MASLVGALVEIIKEAGVSLGMDVLFQKLKNEGSQQMAEKVKKKIDDESRAELLTFIRELAAYEGKEGPDPIASKNLLRRQRDRQNEAIIEYKKTKKRPLGFMQNEGEISSEKPERYPPGSEDLFVTLLTKLYVALGDDERERSARIEVFKWLGRMSDEEFDATLEFLHNDFVVQYIRKFFQIAKVTFVELKRFVENLGANEALKKIDTSIGGTLKDFNDGLEKRWWVRSSNKSRRRL